MTAIFLTIIMVNQKAEAMVSPSRGILYYFNDPLWDGSDCSASNTCCSNNHHVALVYHYLGNSTSDIDDIEARIFISYST